MSIDLELLKNYYSNQPGAEKPPSVRYWCQDESRFDLRTIPGRKITATGVKPVGLGQWQFLGILLIWVSGTQEWRKLFLLILSHG